MDGGHRERGGPGRSMVTEAQGDGGLDQRGRDRSMEGGGLQMLCWVEPMGQLSWAVHV